MTFRPDAIAQDWPRLAEHLETRGYRLSLDTAARQFSSGFANFNYLLEVDGAPCVLRRPPPGPLPPGAHDMVREYRVLSRLWREYPLAPRAFHLCEDVSVLGAPFFLMEYRPGVVIGAELPPSVAARPALAAGIAGDLVDALTRLHRVDPPPSISTPSAAPTDSSPARSPAGRSARTSPTTSSPAIGSGASSPGSRTTWSPSARCRSCTTTSSSTT